MNIEEIVKYNRNQPTTFKQEHIGIVSNIIDGPQYEKFQYAFIVQLKESRFYDEINVQSTFYFKDHKACKNIKVNDLVKVITVICPCKPYVYPVIRYYAIPYFSKEKDSIPISELLQLGENLDL